ncbi:hypothetical protein C8J57DRAFT_232576 [Mycena rebaudengoi]|nr:hypothetical protein C8J57DRAFT_232576 [Mycena rebaudengoi]
MVIVDGGGKSDTASSSGSTEPTQQPEIPRNPSPPPPYRASTVLSQSAANATGSGAIQIVVQHPSPELPSAFQPPTPSSFPHPHPHTHIGSSGPTPLFLPTATPAADTHYPYYDPRSPYSIALADRRAFNRFWSAFWCSIGILVLLWLLGLLQFNFE